MAEIHNISDLDKYSSAFDKAIEKALIASAYKVRDKARADLQSKYPNAPVEGITVGKLNNNKIYIHALGTGTANAFLSRFFVGGAPKKDGAVRKQEGGYRKTKTGVIYTKYQKPMSKGRITPTNSISNALHQQEPTIKQFFNNLKIEE